MDGGAKKAPLPKICHTYPKMMKLGTAIPYLRKIQKNMNHVTHPPSSVDIRFFSQEISKFCYIKEYRYRYKIFNSFNFSSVVKDWFNKKVIILKKKKKMATPGLLKITVF